MAVNPVYKALLQGKQSAEDTPSENVVAKAMVSEEEPRPAAPGTLSESFAAGYRSGVHGLGRDIDYFKALLSASVGDEDEAARHIRNARIEEESAAAPLRGTEEWSDFLEEPTLEGFLQKATEFGGQVVPSVMSSIAGAGVGGLVAAGGRAVVGKSARTAAKRLIEDSLERTAKGVADPDELRLAQLAYKQYRDTTRKVVERGALVGAFGSEYPPLAGSNVSEALESGRELDRTQAFRAAAVALPQAAIGVGGEAALYKLLGNVAKKRSQGEGSIFGQLAASVTRGTAIESTAETAQEEIAIRNRMAMDDTFTAEEAFLRRTQAWFAGAIAGGGAAGVGTTGVAAAQRVAKIDPNEALEKTATVYEKARSLLRSAQEQRVNRDIDNEQYGDLSSTVTTPEAESDINAQLNAIADPTSAKASTWVAGTSARIATTAEAPNTAIEISIKGTTAWAAFIPGKGTIYSKSKDVVEEVINSNASDKALQLALGYSKAKDEVPDGDLVVQVFDAQNNVISEEITDTDSLPGALSAAADIQPEGGRIGQTTLEKALEERAARVANEQSPVSEMSARKGFGEEEVDLTWGAAFKELAALFGGEETIPLLNRSPGLAPRVEDGGVKVEGYEPKKDPNREFDNEKDARKSVEEVSGKVDWSDGLYARMSAALLKTVAAQRQMYPDSIVGVEHDVKTDRFYVTRLDPEGDRFRFETRGKVELLPRDAFIERSIAAAKASKEEYREGTLTGPDGKKSKVNLIDLVNTGRRLIQATEGVPWTGDQSGEIDAIKQSLREVLGDLALRGYSLEVDGFDLTADSGFFTGDKKGSSPRAKFGPVVAFTSTGSQVRLEQAHNERSTINPEAVEVPYLVRDSDGEIIGRLNTPEAQNAVRNTLNDDSLKDVEPDQAVEAYLDNSQERGPRERQEEGDETSPAQMQNRLELALKDLDFSLVPAENLRGLPETEGREDVTPEGPLDDPNQSSRGLPENTAGRPATSSAATTVWKETVDNAPSEPELSWADLPYGESDKLWISELAKRVVARFQSTLKLKNPPAVFSFAELTSADPNSELWAALKANYSDADLVFIEQQIRLMQDDPSMLGRYLWNTNLIIVRESGNPLTDAYVLAHEFGHAFYHQEVKTALFNPALYKRLQAAYEADPLHDTYVEEYGSLGIDEWHADQVARWAVKDYTSRPPKNMPERHFKRIVKKLRRLWQELRRESKELSAGHTVRFGNVNTDFDSYLNAVIKAKRDEDARSDALSITERIFPQAVHNAVVEEGGKAIALHWRKSLAEIARPLMRFVSTADSVLRSYAGDELADMFYVRSQQDDSDGRLGMLGQIGVTVHRFVNEFTDQIGDMNDPAVQAAFREAAGKKTTAELQGKAKQIRLFLERLHEEYIAPSNTDINRLPNYFPIALNLLAIDEAGDQFVDLLVAESPGLTRAEARKAVEKIKRLNQTAADDQPISLSPEDGFNPTDPSAIAERRRLLTLGIDPSILAEQGYLLPPDQAFMSYMHHVVKRVEWNRATDNGARVNQILETLDPEAREVALSTIATYLGYQTSPLSPLWRKVNSYGQFFQFVTILPFAAIGSITDLAGPIINAKEFNLDTFLDGFKQLVYTIKNPEERKQFARDLGLVTNETVANAWVTQAEQDYMDPAIRRASDVWFRMIGLDQFTKFSREFAAGMGVQFIVKHARNEFNNPRSERYLRELGLTAEEVLKWHADGRLLSTPEGKKVAQGVVRFTESSILRPNAAERPLWASDPHWALIWQLKSYFWAYYKVIGGGLMRELKTRIAENPGEEGKLNVAQLTAATSVLALTAVATMPLAMLGLELREWAKYGLAWALPGVSPKERYFRSDRMEWGDYLGEMVDRSGFLGPMSLVAMSNQQMEWGRSGMTPILGPTAETLETIWRNGFDVGKTITGRVLPIYNQL